MTVFRRRRPDGKDRVYSYEFIYQGQRYRGSTGQLDKEGATKWEIGEKERVRRVAGGLEAPRAVSGMPFQEWAEKYYEIRSREVRRPERVDLLLRCVLRFWGAKPSKEDDIPIDETAPYHDLRMTDVIADPYWIERFEQWLREPDGQGRVRSAQTRNHYRSCVSQMFVVASEHTFAKTTGVTVNPFVSIRREKTRRRTVTIDPDDLRRVLTHASYHIRLAMAIGLLAPTMRYSSILALRWDQLNKDWTQITLEEHKTMDETGGPQFIPVSAQLREVLTAAKARAPRRSKHIVLYRGRPVGDINGGVKAAVVAAKVKYGRRDGFTFHSLRHTASSVLNGIGVNAFVVRDLLGHADVMTTAGYTHLVPPVVTAAAEQLSSVFSVADLVADPRTRASRTGGGNGGDSIGAAMKSPAKSSKKQTRKPAQQSAAKRSRKKT
jgi:integrase